MEIQRRPGEPDEHLLRDAWAALAAVDRDPGSGLAVAERAAMRATAWRRPDAASVAERAWGHGLLHCGRLDDAASHLRRSIAWGRRAGSAELAAEARLKLAFAHLQRGRVAAALREIDAALTDLSPASAPRGRAQRGVILHVAGRFDESRAEYDAALVGMRRLDDRLGAQRLLINRALLHTDRHAFAAARRDLAEAEREARALDRPLTIGLIANNAGLMETLRGDVPAALRQLDRAEEIIVAHGAHLGSLAQDRAELLLSVGLLAECAAAADVAITAYGREQRALKVPEVRLLLAQAAYLGGDPDTAVSQGRLAAARFHTQDRALLAAVARVHVLRVERAAGTRTRLSTARLDAMVSAVAAAGLPSAVVEACLVASGVAAQRRVRPDPHCPYLARAAAARQRGIGIVIL